MRISVEKAENAATKMTAKYREQAREIDEKISKIITKEYEVQLPKEVKECYKNFKSYFETTNDVYIIGKGILKERVELNKTFPCKKGETWNITISINDIIADQVVPMINESKELIQKAKNKKEEIRGVLLALGSIKNVLEQFPEAVEYIDNARKPINLPVNLKELRQEFKTEK